MTKEEGGGSRIVPRIKGLRTSQIGPQKHLSSYKVQNGVGTRTEDIQKECPSLVRMHNILDGRRYKTAIASLCLCGPVDEGPFGGGVDFFRSWDCSRWIGRPERNFWGG